MSTTLYHRGRIYSPASPRATAFLVEDERIAWIGSDEVAAGFSAESTVDLEGALVTPAFVDAHVHTTSTGLTLTGLDLHNCPSRDALLDAVARHASTHSGQVILGMGWDETRWPDTRPPTPAELDRAGGGVPVYLNRVDAHSAVVSSALRRPEDPGDAPLTLDAHHAVRATALSSISAGHRVDAQRAARSHAASLGIGALHECGGPLIAGEDDFTGLLALAESEPGPDVFGYWAELGAVEKALELGAVGAAGDLFVDGALGSHTAFLRESYHDRDGHGHQQLSVDQIAEHVLACVERRTQAGFHAIGDGALSVVIDGFARAAAVVGVDRVRAGRHRVEHAEMLDSDLIKGMVEHGLIASVQPAFDAAWGGTSGMYATRLGPDRAMTLNPFGPMLGVGVPLAFGSDSPVTPLAPWDAVRAAVHHGNSHHAISVRAAFAAHTRGGWRAVGRDDEGVLAPGAVATFAIWEATEVVVQVPDERIARWSTDPRAAVPGLPDLSPGAPTPQCLRTVVGGRTVYSAG